MYKRMYGVMLSLLVGTLLAVSGCATVGTAGEECPVDDVSVAPVGAGASGLPPIQLAPPASDADKAYLGLTGTGSFPLGRIKTRIVIVEVFSFYCPHCQRTAAQINDLYRMIEGRADLKGKVKMIGIGAKNSAFEVDSYRERYQVLFPLFPDEEMELTEKLGVRGTPTFIGFKVDGKGSQEKFFFREGDFPDNQKFLAEILRAAGL